MVTFNAQRLRYRAYSWVGILCFGWWGTGFVGVWLSSHGRDRAVG